MHETPPKAECVFFRMAGCITVQRDSDVPLTFAAGSERAWRESDGGKGEGGQRVREEGGRGRNGTE